ncbi:MAG: hypothetical protein ACRD5D_06920 [Candidatus Polarisedimenticolia bacterium]
MSAGGRAPAEASRGDRGVLLGLLGLLAFAAAATPLRNYDYWWHLATGRLILDEGRVPRADPFSFTAAGAPWIDHEWLFQALLYLGHTTVSPAGLVTLKIAAVMLLAWLLATRLWREGHGPAGTAVLLAPALAGAAFRLDVRPELATLLLLPPAIELAIRGRDGGGRRPLLVLPALAAIGANLHVGIVLLPVILLAGAALTVLHERIVAPPGTAGSAAPASFAPRLALTALAAALATGFNPYGWGIWRVPFELSRVLAGLPSPNLEWARPAPGDFPLFFAAAAIAILVLVAGFRRIDPIGAAALLIAAVLAFLHLRNIGLFFLLLPLGLARPARALVAAAQKARLYRTGMAGGRVRPGFVAAAVVLVGSIPAIALLPPRIAWGLGVAADNEPWAAGDFLEREQVGGRLFNDVRFGGYLIWRRAPAHRVYIDGRNEVYADLLKETFEALKDPEAWTALLERHGIDAAFLRYPPTKQKVRYPGRPGGPPIAGERAFAAAYFPKDRWALVYWDDDAMIYLKRSPGNAGRIDRLEYRAIHPDDWQYLFAGVLVGRVPVGPILGDLDRKLREDPACLRAQRLRAGFAGLADELARRDPAAVIPGG